LKKRKVFEFATLIIMVLGDDYLKNYWICNHVFLKALAGNWLKKRWMSDYICFMTNALLESIRSQYKIFQSLVVVVKSSVF